MFFLHTRGSYAHRRNSADTQHKIPTPVILFQASWTYVPFLAELIEYIPAPTFKRIREYMDVVSGVSRGIVAQKQQEISQKSDSSKDLMSLVGMRHP